MPRPKQPFWEQEPWEESQVWGGCWTRIFPPEFATSGQLALILINLPNDVLITVECDGDVGISRLFRITFDPEKRELILE